MSNVELGVIHAATPTPVMPNGELDKAGAKKLFKRMVDIKLDGVLLLGTMGEGSLLPESTREDFVESAVKDLKGKLNLLANASDSSRSRMLAQSKRYEALGVDCIVLCLTPKVSMRKAIEDVHAVAESMDIPCVFYNIPATTGQTPVLDEINEILSHPNIIALKESSGNSLIAQGLTQKNGRPDGVKIFDGDEYRSAYSAMLGFDGVLHGGGVVTAKIVREIWRCGQVSDWMQATELDRLKSLCLAKIYNRFSSPLQNIAGQKYALQLLDGFGEYVDVLADQKLSQSDRGRVEQAVESCRSWLLP